MDSGNIGFVLLCAAFVFVMTPGLGNVLRRSCTKEKCCKHNDDIKFYYRYRNCVGAFRLFRFACSREMLLSVISVGSVLRVFHSRRVTRDELRQFRIWYSLRSR